MKKVQNNKITTIASIIALIALTMGAPLAAEPTGLEIMKKANARDTGTNSNYTISMTLVAKSGSKRTREIVVYSKDYGDIEKTVMSFLAPKDVAGVGYLTWSYDGSGKDDDMWLYMPAMKKVRRIAGSSKNDDFMGTDFTYEDIGNRDIDKDDYTLKESESIDGADCWVVAAVPKDKTEPNSKRILRIRKDTFVVAKAEYFDRQGKLLRVLEVPEIKDIDGIWTATHMIMTNVQDGHSTSIEMKNVRYDTPVDDTLFTVAAIEKGKIK